jgi:hypothetical protein
MTECTIPSCPRPHKARGYCSTHYSAWYQSREFVPKVILGSQSPPCPWCSSDFFVCCREAREGRPVSWRCVSCKLEWPEEKAAVAS